MPYLLFSHRIRQVILAIIFLFSLSLKVVGDTLPVKLIRQFPTQANASVQYESPIQASPLLDSPTPNTQIIVPVGNGLISFINADTGEQTGQVIIPSLAEQQVSIVSTPAQFDNNLIVLYQMVGKSGRESHQVVVIDTTNKRLSPDFPALELTAEVPQADGKTMVKFSPQHAYSHSDVKHAKKAGSTLGYSYVAFGNAGDIQPFHGWLFEIDMDAWKNKGTQHAIKNVLVTTPESQCNMNAEYGMGTREMICAGGIWTSAGPQVEYYGNDYELLVPTGNGQLDLSRHDYANSLMRVKPGLVFDPGCDAKLCKDFNPKNPALACIKSCKNLFIPRLKQGDKPLKPITGECDKYSFWECLAWMDYDLGANAPVKIKLDNHQSVIIQASKEGAIYLLDAHHLGTMFDRLQLIESCGSKEDPCRLSWRGMMVTHPVASIVGGTPVIIVPTFVSDKTHISGVMALKIVYKKGQPQFERFWQYPNATSPEAITKFRAASTRPLITSLSKHGDVVWVVDIGKTDKVGTLYGIRVKDGKLIAESSMLGAGAPLSKPIAVGNKLYFPSKKLGSKTTWIESYLVEE